MKKVLQVVFVFAILMAFTGCKKAPKKSDYFIFGTYNGECVGNCVRYFLLKDGFLFEDDNVQINAEPIFSDQALSDDKRQLAEHLRAQFPQSVRFSKTYGCPDCHDQGGYYVEIFRDGKLVKLDIDPGAVPAELKDFFGAMVAVLRVLN